MRLKYSLTALAIGAVAAFFAIAQGQETFKARLSPVPSDAKTRPDVAGLGSATATLAGTKLTISGTFEGLKSAAVVARVHDGLAEGVRGPAIHDLTVEKAMTGRISGSFDLTPEQVQHLKQGHLYVQLHSEKTPDGTLWGWLLP